MSFVLRELAEKINGEALGEVDLVVDALLPLDEAAASGVSPLLRKKLLEGCDPLPGAILATEELARAGLDAGVPGAIACAEPLPALARLVDLFHPEPPAPAGIHPTAIVDPGARVHPTAYIGPGAVVEAGAEIGEGTSVGPGAVICAAAVVGKRVRIGPGSVIGGDGFGFVPHPEGPIKIRHVGRTVIEDDVEIGALSCVDRGTLGATVIGRASKLDNLVQVGHNARVGKRVLIAGQTGLAGSTVIGDDAMLGGNVGVADHVEVGCGARVGAKSGVGGNVAPGETVSGYPAIGHARWLRTMARLARSGDKKK